MPTTLLQEVDRTADQTFRAQVRAAVFRVLPDVIGEDAGTMQPARVAKRHSWAMGVLERPTDGVDRVVSLLAGEPAIRNVMPPALVPDDTIVARVRALVDDFAGVLASEKV